MVRQFYLAPTLSGTYVASGDMGVYINSDTFLNTPLLDYNEYTVPGRDGNLINYNKRLSNVVRKFDCFIKDDVEANFNKLKRFLYQNPGYFYIKSDYDPERYQKGYLAQEIEVAPFNKGGNYSIQFSLYFSCEPFKYLTLENTKTVTPQSFGQYHVISRNSATFKNLLEKLPQGNVPDDQLFFIWQVGLGTTITNVSASSNTGNNFFALYEGSQTYGDWETVTQVFGSGLNNLPNIPSVTPSTNSSIIYMVCGYLKAGIVTQMVSGLRTNIDLVRTGQGVTLGTNTVGAYFDKINVKVTSYSGSSSTWPNFITVTRALNGSVVDLGNITLFPDGEIPSASDYPDYFYTEDSKTKFDIEIDLIKNTVSLVKEGLNPVNINDFALIDGNFGGYTDRLFISGEAEGNWRIENAVTTPRMYAL